MASRSSEIRAFVRQMSKIHQCDMDAEYYDARQHWVIRWHDGPTRKAMLAAVQRHLPEHKDIVYAGRDLSDEATVLGAIRCYVSGEVHRWNTPRYAAEHLLEDVAFPLRTATARELAMVERLLEESAQDRPWGRDRNADHALELLTERKGIGWLLTPPAAPDGRQPEADAAPPVLEPTPVELLTARYARGDQGTAWRERATPMPLVEAFAAALADEEIDRDAALAALTLVADLQAVLDANTAALMARARGAGGSWSDVGQALGGITKQSAAKKYGVLTSPAKRASANG
ncbi:hypothetical protein [Kitasatospora sp. NPDC090091]|uniref:hypothetical protein n=1 Tax=Kitasatospora sp. NPDC090091 TaxID=3364081 RepID=UPI0037F421A0